MKKFLFVILSSFCFYGPSFGASQRLLHPDLDFSLTPKEISTRCSNSLAKAQKKLDELVAINNAEQSFQNTAVGFDQILLDLDDELSAASFLEEVSTDDKVRDASHDCNLNSAQFSVDVYTREDIYSALSSISSRQDPLGFVDQKLLNKIILEFKRNGLGLTSKDRKRVKKIKMKLARLELDFDKNISDVKDFLAVTHDELDGLPGDYIKRLEVLRDGKYKVTLDYPDYFPFMRNAKNAAARRRLEAKFNSRAANKNIKLLKRILKLRHEAAKVLGYPTHAHYIVEDRMAKNPDKVIEFLSRLRIRLQEKAKPELALLSSLKMKDTNEGLINTWDFGYYHNLLKKTRYEVDDEAIKEYFPLELVTEGMLNIYQELLDLRFEEASDVVPWHSDVKLYVVYDKSTSELMGHFFMDLFPREGKYKHAAAFNLIVGRGLLNGQYQRPISAIIANFNKPTQEAPSLLKHSEVETFFHEFGHIMHQLLTRSQYGRFSGTRVARDFVEAPSQMLENWVWKPEVLKRLSGHYKDKTKKLPDDLLERMVAVKNLNSGLSYLYQVFLATVDMTYHTQEKIKDTTALYSHLKNEITLIPMSPDTHPEASFGHLTGYDAAYYGYLWSEVFALDMFSRFETEGFLNPKIGREYRQLILEPGGSLDEAEELVKFLGREPNEEAFLKNIGLK